MKFSHWNKRKEKKKKVWNFKIISYPTDSLYKFRSNTECKEMTEKKDELPGMDKKLLIDAVLWSEMLTTSLLNTT